MIVKKFDQTSAALTKDPNLSADSQFKGAIELCINPTVSPDQAVMPLMNSGISETQRVTPETSSKQFLLTSNALLDCGPKSSAPQRDCDGTSDNQFAYWLAGLIDGDGTLLINKLGHTACEITLHEEDVDTLIYIKNYIGYGPVSKRSGAKAYRWRIQDKKNMLKLLDVLNGKLLTSNRQSQFLKICELYKVEPIINKKLNVNNSWFAGFFDAEGYLSIRNKYTLTLSVSQADESILKQILNEFNRGNIYYDSSWKGYNYCITDRPSLLKMIEYFEKYPLKTIKNKDWADFLQILLKL